MATIDELWPILTPEQLSADLFAEPDRLEIAAPDLTDAERAPAARATRRTCWTAADVPLLDEAAELLGVDDCGARSTRPRSGPRPRSPTPRACWRSCPATSTTTRRS